MFTLNFNKAFATTFDDTKSILDKSKVDLTQPESVIKVDSVWGYLMTSLSTFLSYFIV